MAILKYTAVDAKHDFVAATGEFVGTAMFLFLALGGAKTAIQSQTVSQTQTTTDVTTSNETLMYISVSFGMSLVVTAWMFYRITGGLFNPAITLALWLIGAVPGPRSILLVFSQILGGIAGAALLDVLTPFGGVADVETKLSTGVNKGQGLFIEAFCTAILVFSVLMLAAEKHKATFMAPLVIGLTLFIGQLFATQWTGCGMNPARAFGPAVVQHSFPGYHWIYWVGPFLGSLISVGFYTMLKSLQYDQVVFGQDDDHSIGPAPVPLHQKIYNAVHNRRLVVYHGSSSHTHTNTLSNAEKGSGNPNGTLDGANGGADHLHGTKDFAAGSRAARASNANSNPPRVVAFDKDDPEMMAAVRAGEATVVNVPHPDSDAIQPALPVDGEVEVPGVSNRPHMASSMQNVGGISAPASHGGGLAKIGRLSSVYAS